MANGLDLKCTIDAGGYHLTASRVFFILGIIFAILGVIGDVMNATLGLEPISWFLLAIGAFVASIPPCLGWAMAVHLKAREAKKEQ